MTESNAAHGAQPSVLGFAPPAEAGPAVRRDRWSQLLVRPAAWIPILGLQAALALRLNGPISTDEATYVVAGQRLISNLLSGSAVQDYGTYFSGIPGLYPVLAAAIDDVGGLAAVRAFSLLCMLAVNLCLYLIAAALFGRPSAIFASLVFAIGSGVSFIGWYATFDAPSLALLALATLLALQAAERPGWRREVAIGVVLVLAVAVKYVALEYVPAVLGILVLRGCAVGSWRRAFGQPLLVIAAGAAGAAVTVAMVSPSNWIGFTATSSSGRVILQGTDKLSLLELSWSYIGCWMLLALLGVLIAWKRASSRLMAGLLFATGMLPIVTHVVLGEEVSLHKHTAFGFFFAAPLAGLAVATAFAVGRRRTVRGLPGRNLTATTALIPAAMVAWIFIMLGTGMSSASNMKFGWPIEEDVVTALDPYVNGSGNYLADNPSIPSYLFDDRTLPSQWTAPWFFGYVIDGVMVFGDQALERAVLDQYFDVIVYRPTTFTPEQQEQLLPAIVARYQLADSLPYGGGQWSIWIPIR
jgi:4-amino-4-deoxy-L-arabinose transferase-like glycosyltransferase